MTLETVLDTLKSAILLELRGKSFYETSARGCHTPELREFFEVMASEEASHVDLLSREYVACKKNGAFTPADLQAATHDFHEQILTEKLKQHVTAAGYEAAAIDAALALEDRAVTFYTACASQTSDPNEAAIYRWLADWEKTHVNLLTHLDGVLKEMVWNDNQFWPF